MAKQLKSLTFVNDNISNTYQVSEPLPATTEADKGKVLTVDESGAQVWQQPAAKAGTSVGSVVVGTSSNSGPNSLSVGTLNQASGNNSFAQGLSSKATGGNAFASGSGATASGIRAHAEGYITTASGKDSHAEGYITTASGKDSHAEGYATIAASDYQHVQGKYNIEDGNNEYAHIVGNGTGDARSNAHTIDWEGNAWFAGKIYVGGTGLDDETAVEVATLDNSEEWVFELEDGSTVTKKVVLG